MMIHLPGAPPMVKGRQPTTTCIKRSETGEPTKFWFLPGCTITCGHSVAKRETGRFLRPGKRCKVWINSKCTVSDMVRAPELFKSVQKRKPILLQLYPFTSSFHSLWTVPYPPPEDVDTSLNQWNQNRGPVCLPETWSENVQRRVIPF